MYGSQHLEKTVKTKMRRDRDDRHRDKTRAKDEHRNKRSEKEKRAVYNEHDED